MAAQLVREYLRRTETFVANQIAALERYEPFVVCHHRRADSTFPFPGGVAASDVATGRLAALDPLAYRAKLALPGTMRRLADTVQAHEARLLHAHYLVDARYFLGIRERTGLPLVVSAYGYDVTEFPHRLRGQARRYLTAVFRRADAILAMSERMRADLVELGCPDAVIRTHYHGVDTARFAVPERSYATTSAPLVLCCGTLWEKKGQDLLLAALREVERAGGPDFRVLFVGDGPMRPELERTVAANGWQERVRFAGHLPHLDPALPRAYAEADVFALPAVTLADGSTEGIPGTVVEAMAAGLAVVATVHGGIPSVVESGSDGLLVAERDIDGLAAALDATLRDAGLRRDLGTRAALRARSALDVHVAARALERIYDELAEQC